MSYAKDVQTTEQKSLFSKIKVSLYSEIAYGYKKRHCSKAVSLNDDQY